MHWWNFLCNCNAFGSLEEIHLAKRNRTDMRYSYCRGFPMTINPDMCPTSLSKISLNSSLYRPHIFWDLPCSHLLDTRSLKCDLFFVVWKEICGHTIWVRETYEPHCQIMHFACSDKKETLVWCLHWMSAVPGCWYSGIIYTRLSVLENVTWKFKGLICKPDVDDVCR